MVIFGLIFTHPERWRDRPGETSATAERQVPIPAGRMEKCASWKMRVKDKIALFLKRDFVLLEPL